MKKRNLVVVLLCLVLGLFYMLYIRSTDDETNAKSLTTNQLDVLFSSIAELSGHKQAVLNIVKNGEYALPSENFTFDYDEAYDTSFKALQRVKNITQRPTKQVEPTQWNGYLKIHKYGEELSKQMRIFLAVANFPGFQKMKLAAPRFKNGYSKSNGPTPFDAVYNFDELNQIYSKNGYPPIVSDKEYDDVCKHSKPVYVVVFVPPYGRHYTKNLTEKLYGKDGNGGVQWINCDGDNSIRVPGVHMTKRKTFCTTFNFDISILRQSVLKDVKCIQVPEWTDHGLLDKSGPNGLSPDDIFHYFLNPSDVIMNEANSFTKQYLERPYLAIHIRAHHMNAPPTTVKRCFMVAMGIIDALKRKRGVKSIYISTDMNKYGGDMSYVPGFEEYLAEISGAVRYNPKTTGHLKDISRTTISLTNMLLLSQSDHLIAMGSGSFHIFVMGQFFKQHFEKDPKTWSMIRMCENARQGNGMTRPAGDYSKWEI